MVPRDSKREEQLKRTKESAASSKEEEGSEEDEDGSVPEANELPKKL